MSTKAKTKNDQAWEHLFEKYNILDSVQNDGYYKIRSSEINEFREARLMTKFDHSFQLPYMFADSGLSLLPKTRGEYIISEIKTFASFNDSSSLRIHEMEAPIEWESLDYKNVTSEATAINCAYVGGLLNDFLNEDVLYPTVDGRMSSSEFVFDVAKNKTDEFLKVSVKNSQIEIDGGYEGHGSFTLIEAKNTLAPDFLIRQLYYPYRLWEQKIGKPVKNIFLTYTNGIYHFREYQFTNINQYNSIELIREKKYRFRERTQDRLNLEVLHYYINNLPIIDEPRIPFPQADSFERVINLCEVIRSSEDKGVTKDDLLSNFYFTDQDSLAPRQVDYYINASRYLGFVDKETRDGNITYILTEQGERLFKLSVGERQNEFVKAVLNHGVFRKVLIEYLKIGYAPPKEQIVFYMRETRLFNIKSDVTFGRRASTIIAWIDWILAQLEE